ncbi:hypothetical protein JVX90_17130 [Gordonia sp. PDNC005]|uniref:hypothetical protein n=1 Tax=unclassified Gordonia (in: high G+C Gram-positive bacteria) TaxID=2657482 RepID=UPI0019626FEC|nr:hypothetical protein [Gordonia sp. PDNC005]QRY62096.1 hypothetical protein JVX90_17130 [Gordonia sp. PDNC005]
MTEKYERLRLAPDLNVTRDRDFLIVSTPRWEPGTFVYDLDFLAVKSKPASGSVRVVLSARGAHVDFQVLRFELDAPMFAVFEDFLARATAP